jgi:hypothetical protein
LAFFFEDQLALLVVVFVLAATTVLTALFGEISICIYRGFSGCDVMAMVGVCWSSTFSNKEGQWQISHSYLSLVLGHGGGRDLTERLVSKVGS